MSDHLETRKTLLYRAKDQNDQLAWEDFVGYYSDFIQMLLWKMNVPVNEHSDLKQEILIKIWKAMQEFEYDSSKGRFRNWLSLVIRNAVLHYMRTHRTREKREWNVTEDDRGFAPDPENTQELDTIINEEWAHYMVEHVVDHLKQFFSGKAIDVFMLSSKGKKSEEISAELNIPLNTVYVLRNRVKVRFMQEIKTLRNMIEF